MTEGVRPRAPLLAALCASIALAGVLWPAPARAQGEGPRAFELGPVASQLLNVYGFFGRANDSFNPGSVVPGGGEVVVNGGIIEYAHGLAFAGKSGSLTASLPFGEVSRSIKVGSAMRTDSRSGVGDLQLTAAFDRNSPVNLGQNRWALQLGLPLALYLGDSFLDPTLTSFELIPSVIGYGDNDEPSSGNRSTQAPLLQLEGHVTRNLNHRLWVSLDALFIQGGETTTDGVSDHNRQRSLALGATVSVVVSDTISTMLSYTDEVSRNHTGVSGHVIRLLAEFSL
jgi:Putative MetA-pathway of phenol degradation